jgi:hypothetical protein
VIIFFIATIRIPAVAFIPFWFILQILFYVDWRIRRGGIFGTHGWIHSGSWNWICVEVFIREKVAVYSHMRKTLIHTPKIENANPLPEPEVIESADFYEIVAEIRGIYSATDIQSIYEPDYKRVSMMASGSRKYQFFVKLPDSATNPSIESI